MDWEKLELEAPFVSLAERESHKHCPNTESACYENMHGSPGKR